MRPLGDESCQVEVRLLEKEYGGQWRSRVSAIDFCFPLCGPTYVLMQHLSQSHPKLSCSAVDTIRYLYNSLLLLQTQDDQSTAQTRAIATSAAMSFALAPEAGSARISFTLPSVHFAREFGV